MIQGHDTIHAHNGTDRSKRINMSQPTVLNSISWRDLCPWLMLSRSIAIAISPSIVIIAFLGILLTPLGWSMGEWALTEEDTIAVPHPDDQEDRWIKIRTGVEPETFWQDQFRQENWFFGQGPLLVFEKLYKGHTQLLNPKLNIRQSTYYLVGSAWMLLLWSFLGTMICRIAATRFTRDERTGIFEAFSFARKRMISIWTSSFVPLGIIVAFAIPLAIVGLMMSVDFLLMFVGFGYFLIALVGLVMAIGLIPLFFGYPLLWPAIATEGSDAFEAVSRSYSYPTQKPYHYVFYWIVILVIGYLAAFVASILATKSVEFAQWGSSWGAGTERIEQIEEVQIANNIRELREEQGLPDEQPSDLEVDEEISFMLATGADSIEFWQKGIQILTIGFNYGFFFVAMTGMYLLLRQDNDYMELDEVFVDDEEDLIPLPQLQSTAPALPQQLVAPEPSQAAPSESEPGQTSGDSNSATTDNQAKEPEPATDVLNQETAENQTAETDDEQPIVEEEGEAEEEDDEEPRIEDE